jgi:fluoroacetyl-CoA thioesterase
VDLTVGTKGEVDVVVTATDTAAALGSGSLAVLGTPRLLAWSEQATCRALDPSLPPGSTSVGTSVRLEHLTATGVGERVAVHALVTEVDGRRVVFAVTATDAAGTVIARGTVERVVVDERRFLARVGSDRRLAGRERVAEG